MLTLEKVLITISGLLDNNPISYEPAYTKIKETDDKAIKYAICSRVLCLQTVPDMLKRDTEFKEEINDYYKNNKELYLKSLDKLTKYDNQTIVADHNTIKINIKIS